MHAHYGLRVQVYLVACYYLCFVAMDPESLYLIYYPASLPAVYPFMWNLQNLSTVPLYLKPIWMHSGHYRLCVMLTNIRLKNAGDGCLPSTKDPPISHSLIPNTRQPINNSTTSIMPEIFQKVLAQDQYLILNISHKNFYEFGESHLR